MPSRNLSLPTPGTAIPSVQDLARSLARVAEQAATGITIDPTSSLAGDAASSGLHLSPTFQTTLMCFQILTCWERGKKAKDFGATNGLNWVCYGQPVGYWLQGVDGARYWQAVKGGQAHPNFRNVPLWWPETSAEDEDNWQKVLYPLYGIDQWVWCTYDYSAAVWRVVHTYDDIVRISLRGPMTACVAADADVIGYKCGCPDDEGWPSSSSSRPSSSSSSPGSTPPSSSASSENCGACTGWCHYQWYPELNKYVFVDSDCAPNPHQCIQPSSGSSSASAGTCCPEDCSRGIIQVIDRMGIINTAFCDGTAPAGSKGWAKRMADSSEFELLSIGRCTAPGCEVAENQLIECCLIEDHPGYGIQFRVYVGSEWVGDRWVYDCTTQANAIDWRYGTPYPLAGARGLFQKHSTDNGDIYECVSLDCTPPEPICGGSESSSGQSSSESSSGQGSSAPASSSFGSTVTCGCFHSVPPVLYAGDDIYVRCSRQQPWQGSLSI